MADDFQQWARDGRLATVALVIVFSTWVAFQIWVAPIDRPSMLDQLLWTIAGGWLANIALVQGKRENGSMKKKDDDDA